MFKKSCRRECHVPATPYERALAHPRLSKLVKRRLRELYRTLDPVALLAEMRAAQAELGTRVSARAGKLAATANPPATIMNPATFAKRLGSDVHLGEQRIIHRRMCQFARSSGANRLILAT